MDVLTRVDGLVSKCSYYQVVKNSDGKFGLRGFASNEIPSLSVYDALAGDYQLVVKIDLVSGVEKVEISGTTSVDYFLGDGNHPLLSAKSVGEPHVPKTGTTTDGKSYTNSLSSIVGLTVLTADEATALESGSLATLPKEDRLSTFVSSSGGGYSISADIVVGECEGSSVYAYVTYASLLVNTVFSANIGNDDMYLKQNGEVVTGSDGLPYPIPFKWDFLLAVEVL